MYVSAGANMPACNLMGDLRVSTRAELKNAILALTMAPSRTINRFEYKLVPT